MLTVPEAAERLRLTPKTVRKRIQSGEIAAMKSGPFPNSGYRISEAALAEYEQRQTVKPAAS